VADHISLFFPSPPLSPLILWPSTTQHALVPAVRTAPPDGAGAHTRWPAPAPDLLLVPAPRLASPNGVGAHVRVGPRQHPTCCSSLLSIPKSSRARRVGPASLATLYATCRCHSGLAIEAGSKTGTVPAGTVASASSAAAAVCWRLPSVPLPIPSSSSLDFSVVRG
jgi:hypothetical protein